MMSGTYKYSGGNGAIIRMVPLVIAAASEKECVDLALKQTKLTHGSTEYQIPANRAYRGNSTILSRKKDPPL